MYKLLRYPIDVFAPRRSLLEKLCILLLLTLMLASCDAFSTVDSSVDETQTAISIQQTQVAEKLNVLSAEDRQATIDAQAALGGQDTSVEETPETGVEVTQQQPDSATQTTQPTNTPEPTEPADLESSIKSANILLYEDMVNYTDTNRYVKDTLDDMGLNYKDDGSAKGWLKADIASGAPGGKPWDLVILAAEAKTGPQGEFFGYVLDALDKGSSVIMEVWYLERTFNGSASAMLSRCGVQFENDWRKVPPSAMVMFPMDASHPIMFEPNTLSFTNVTSYWWDEDGEKVYDIGDTVKIGSGGDARILLSNSTLYENSHGTLTVCIDDRLILQTFSSHQISFDNMKLAWENYINHALKVRFTGSQ